MCYAPILYRLVLNWTTNPDMGHGFFVPIVAGYIVWKRRTQLLAIPRQPNIWGLAVVVISGLLALAATLGAELFTARLAFLLALAGALLFLGGWAWILALRFPLLLLLFMIPIPQIIYSQVTLSLQLMASRLAEGLIELSGIPVLRTGNILVLPHQTLNIVDACSGIRSLISLSFLALIYAYFADKRVWMRWALLAATIPIAIAANALRVGITGILTQFNIALAQGIYHEIEGYLVFAFAMVALVGVHLIFSSGAARLVRPGTNEERWSTS